MTNKYGQTCPLCHSSIILFSQHHGEVVISICCWKCETQFDYYFEDIRNGALADICCERLVYEQIFKVGYEPSLRVNCCNCGTPKEVSLYQGYNALVMRAEESQDEVLFYRGES